MQIHSFNNFRILKYLIKLMDYHAVITGLNNYPQVRSVFFPLLTFGSDLFNSNKSILVKLNSLFSSLLSSLHSDAILNELISSFISEDKE